MPVVQHLQYDDGGALAEVEVTDRASTQTQVHGLRYNARGQRTQVEHGNGVTTTFTYDPDTFRLTRQVAERSDTSKLQDLRLTWGPAGQIYAIRDGIQTLVYYDNEITHPERQFVYDARGRLIRATGREHATTYGLDPASVPSAPCSIPGPANEVVGYIRDYEWDAAGNMTELSVVGGWTRTLVYESGSNRLKTFTWSSPSTTTNYITYDQFGQMEGLPSAKDLRWDGDGNLRYSAPLTTGATTRTWYQYSGAQRVRKVTEKEHATGWYVAKETMYLDGGFEVYRTYDAPGTLELEREHVRITDGAGHALEIETVLVEGGIAVSTITPLYRYSLVDQIGSVSVELDHNAAVVTCEEYHPFGTTAYYGDTRGAQAKRYRYSGKERDAETGLYYYGYRYYAAGVARWTAPDPGGAIDGLNLFAAMRGDPIGRNDPNGLESPQFSYTGIRIVDSETFDPMVPGEGSSPAFVQFGGASLHLFGFDVDSDALLPPHIEALELFAADAIANGRTIAIVGRTSSTGRELHNFELGLRRGFGVGDSLISMGVAPDQIVYIDSVGELEPWEPHLPDNTESSLERGVDLYVLSSAESAFEFEDMLNEIYTVDAWARIFQEAEERLVVLAVVGGFTTGNAAANARGAVEGAAANAVGRAATGNPRSYLAGLVLSVLGLARRIEGEIDPVLPSLPPLFQSAESIGDLSPTFDAVVNEVVSDIETHHRRQVDEAYIRERYHQVLEYRNSQ